MTVWNLALSLVLGAGGLVVDSASPDALCPPLEATRATVAARLGNVELDGAWRASYVVVHRAEGDFVSLTLVDPDGAVRLQRELPIRGGSCETLSQVIALVLERFFQRPEAAAVVEPAPLVPTPPQPQARVLAATTSTPEEPPRRAPESRPPDRASTEVPIASSAAIEPAWSVAAALWASNAWLAPELRVTRALGERYRVALSVGLDLADHELAFAEGSVSTQRVPVSLGLSRRVFDSDELRANLGVELLTMLEHARSRGLDATGDGVRAVPGAGIRVGADFLDADRIGPFAELTGAAFFRTAAPAFEIQHQEVLRPPGLVVGLVLGLRSPL